MWSAKKKENNLVYLYEVLEWNTMHWMPEISALNIRHAMKIQTSQTSITKRDKILNSLMKIFVGN